MVDLRFRQVHLDFHTSADCPDVGADFDSEQFAETVKLGHVDSMTLFAKCHHGFSYYPTKVGTMHPNLTFDLMGKQIESLHSVGVRAPIYVSMMWDDLAGEEHPDWVIARKDGSLTMRPPLFEGLPPPGGVKWTTLDPATGYGDYFLAQVEEICQNYPVDGFFFDICNARPNYSAWGQAQMRKAGVRLDDDAAVMEYARKKRLEFFERVSGLVCSKVPNATIFYNGTSNPTIMHHVLPYTTHFEIESLPTSGHIWGYLHYPTMARHIRTYGLDFLGMTGRFHKSWADFGGLKTNDQLEYECGTIVGAGGKISVGDQLHPRGALDPAVYRLIGHSFERIEKLEPWLRDATPAAEVGILSLLKDEFTGTVHSWHTADVEGATQLFLESAIQFDIVDADHPSFDRYGALVLPDRLRVNNALREKLETFIENGGKLVMVGTATLDPVEREFNLSGVPVRYLEPCPTTPSYLRLDEALKGSTELATDYDYVFYELAHRVEPVAGAAAHGGIRRALFNRNWEHFVSHAHAPVGDDLNAPIVVEQGNILYFAAPLFAAYREHDYWVYRAVAVNALNDFLPQRLVKVSGPGWAEVTLHTQSADEEYPARQIVHVVTYHPRRSMQPVPHVDQSWITSDMSIKVLRQNGLPQRVYLAPDMQPLSFAQDGDYVQIDLPPVGTHTVIVIE